VASASARRSSMPRCSLTRRRAPPTALALAAAASASYCRVRASKSVSASPVIWPVGGSCLVVKRRQTSAHLAWHSTLVCPGSICKAAHKAKQRHHLPLQHPLARCLCPGRPLPAGEARAFLLAYALRSSVCAGGVFLFFFWFCYWSPSMRILDMPVPVMLAQLMRGCMSPIASTACSSRWPVAHADC